MVSALIQNVALNNHSPAGGMLPYHQNCVAMAFSRTLGIGVNAAVNLFIANGWVGSASALQYDNAIATIVAQLPLANVALDESWLSLKPRLSTLPDGRYFAVNSGANNFGGTGIGHAFAIVKHGSWGTAANNSEKTDSNYGSNIAGSSKISLWGPA
jgi:hypothetical protein